MRPSFARFDLAAVHGTDAAKQGFQENAAGEDRTPDLRIMRPTRCQLRYCRSWRQEGRCCAGAHGFDLEPFSGQRQLCADERGAQIPALGFEPRFLPRVLLSWESTNETMTDGSVLSIGPRRRMMAGRLLSADWPCASGYGAVDWWRSIFPCLIAVWTRPLR